MNVSVGRVRGIPIQLHVTFVLILPLFGFLMARAYFAPTPGAMPDVIGWVWGSLLAIGLFASVLAHELAHSLVALREGIKVRSITLLPMGGVSSFEKITEDPVKELRITLVGPLTNFVIGVPLFFAAPFIPEILPMVGAFVHRLGLLNLLVGGFNLLVPAFPMDGGRILRAILVTKLGRLRATRVASAFGQVIALLFGFVGFLTFGAGGWLLILIAVFVFMGARGEESATFIAESLAHYRVRDIMTRDVITLEMDATVEEALDQMQRTRHLALPLVSADGTVAGVVDLAKLREVPQSQREWTRVGDHVRENAPRAHSEDAAQDLARLMTGGAAPVLVFDANETLVGIVTPTDVARFTEVTTVRGRRVGPTGRW